jgi:hypothetical protein
MPPFIAVNVHQRAVDRGLPPITSIAIGTPLKAFSIGCSPVNMRFGIASRVRHPDARARGATAQTPANE